MANLISYLSIRVRSMGERALTGIVAQLGRVEKQATQTSRAMGRLRDPATGRYLAGGRGGGPVDDSLFGRLTSRLGNLHQATQGLRKVRDTTIGIMRQPIEEAMDYGKALAFLQTKMDGIDAGSMQRLKALSLDLAPKYGKSPTEVVEAMRALGASGVQAPEMASILPSTLALSRVTEGLTPDASADLLVTTLTQLGLGTDKTSYVADLLQQTANAAPLTVSDIGETASYAFARGKNIGLSPEQMFQMAALAGEGGLKGSAAGTGMKEFFGSYGVMSKKAHGFLRKLHVSEKWITDNYNDPMAILARINEEMDKRKLTTRRRDEVLETIYGERGYRFAAAMTAGGKKVYTTEDGTTETGFERIPRLQREAKGSVERANETVQKTPSAQLDALKARWEGFLIKIGDRWMDPFMGYVTKVVDKLGQLSEWADRHPQAIEMLGKVGLAVAGLSTAVVPAFYGLGALASAMEILGGTKGAAGLAGALTRLSMPGGPIMLAIAGIAAIGAALVAHVGSKAKDPNTVEGGMAGLPTYSPFQDPTKLPKPLPVKHFGGNIKGVSKWETPQLTLEEQARYDREQAEKTRAAALADIHNGKAKLGVSLTPTEPATVNGEIKVLVQDERTKVITTSKGPVQLRTGTQPGAR